MAVTKIKPIRGTVNKAIAYIIDPKKTDDELLVSSFGCAANDSVAKEFEVDAQSCSTARSADSYRHRSSPDTVF